MTRNVPDHLLALDFLTTWPGSQVDTTLIDPMGKVITPLTADEKGSIRHLKGSTFQVYRVEGNGVVPGVWQIEIYGADLPAGGDEVGLKVDARGQFLAYLSLIWKR